MFTIMPESFFPNTRIDIVEFPNGYASNEFYEKKFSGPIQNQLKESLSYIKTNIIKEKVIKSPSEAESARFFNYPYQAIEEAVANAVYHKNYEIQEQIEIRIMPESIQIINQGGIDPSIRPDDFLKGAILSRRYRNRRIGEFLKELRLTEGRGTGIPTIINELRRNGSPLPKFDTDGDRRSYFIIDIPIHPGFLSQHGAYVSAQENGKEKIMLQAQTDYRLISVLQFCLQPRTRINILQNIGLTNHFKNYKKHVLSAVNQGLLNLSIPENPRNRNQKYVTTDKGKQFLNSIRK